MNKQCPKYQVPICQAGWYLLEVIDNDGKIDYICPQHCTFPDSLKYDVEQYDEDKRNNPK